MIHQVYCLRDRKLGVYMTPFFDKIGPADELETIRRMVIVNRDQAAKLADTELYHLGEYNDESGKLILKEENDFVGDVAKFLEALKNG